MDNLWKEENGFQPNSILNGYHAQFTRNIYAPLISEYVNKPQPYLLNGDSNLLLQQLSEVYGQFLLQRRRRLPSNHSLQIDIRSMNSLKISPHLDNDEDDEDDYCQSIENNTNFKPSSLQMDNDEDDEDDYCQSIENNTNFKPYFSSNHKIYKDNLVTKMRELIPLYDGKSFCYKRYEILLYGDQFQIFEANTNNQIPNCEHPLPKLYNTIEGFDTHKPGLLTFTFLVDHDCIRVYTMLADGTRQLYGTRTFKDDLIQTIPKLFQDNKLSETTLSVLDRLQFIPDPVYEEYYKYMGVAKQEKAIQSPILMDDIGVYELKKSEEMHETEQDDVDSDDEYDPYDDYQLFEGLLDQPMLHHDEILYYQQETNKYLLHQLKKCNSEFMDLSNELVIIEDDYENFNAFNNQKIESGLELPSDSESGW
eukprot:CAMPEP_0201592472 /NCGR_PEP_ID=MMETSP0190_2-20130828/190358_1 /ASSEMBLY_ACC=CAM_ASM_000263 /TAXON_ID=37353 /ORGANISM="Rosalina sp." /LENGTH=421 /DNA_ID=CAMNT_0048051261 /DNA_START=252 /DNA_END=1518 /DNA_ORIENTATION=-